MVRADLRPSVFGLGFSANKRRRVDELERLRRRKFYGIVALEGFDRFIFSEPQGVISVGQVATAILGALPEFPAIFSEEERLIFLGFMPENSAAAAQYFLWAERDGEIDFIERPFCPGSPIEPEFGLSQPSNFGRGGLGQRVAQDMQTQAMRAVGVI